MLEELEKTPPMSEEEYQKMIVNIIEAIERQEANNIVTRMAIHKIVEIIERIHGDIKFLIPELKELIEEQDGLRGYMSENLSPRLVSLEEKSYTKKKDVI